MNDTRPYDACGGGLVFSEQEALRYLTTHGQNAPIYAVKAFRVRNDETLLPVADYVTPGYFRIGAIHYRSRRGFGACASVAALAGNLFCGRGTYVVHKVILSGVRDLGNGRYSAMRMWVGPRLTNAAAADVYHYPLNRYFETPWSLSNDGVYTLSEPVAVDVETP
jgi:hypothetical protein